jgi:hypothetical protein
VPEKRRLLELALKGLEAERAKLEEEINQVKSQLGLSRATPTGRVQDPAPRKRRRMSAAARRRISEAMKRRHAEMKKGIRRAA